MRTLLCALAAVAALAPCAGAIDFLVPGMPLASATLSPGERASYLVVTRSLGSVDSSIVEIGVLEHRAGRIGLEIVLSSYPPRPDETTTVRMLLAERVLAISSANEFRECLLEARLREGSGRFREATEQELDDLGVEDLFIPADPARSRTALAPRTVRTKAGSFPCAGIETVKRDERDVILGGVKARRVEEERTVLWRSGAAPLWGLVASSVERRSSVERSGAAFSAPPRVTITESALLSSFRRAKR